MADSVSSFRDAPRDPNVRIDIVHDEYGIPWLSPTLEFIDALEGVGADERFVAKLRMRHVPRHGVTETLARMLLLG